MKLSERRRRWRLALSVLCLAGIGLAVIGTVADYDTAASGDRSATGAMSDFRDAIYEPVRALAAGSNPYDHVRYLAERPVDQELPPYFPLNYAVFAPLALLPLPLAAAVFLAVSLGALGALALLVSRRGGDTDPVIVGLAVFAAMLWSRPGFQALQYGQSAPFVALALVALSVGLHEERRRLVTIAVIVAWAKPSLGLPLAVLVAYRGQWVAAAWGSAIAFASWIPVGALMLRTDGPIRLVELMMDNLAFSADHPFGALLGPTRVDAAATLAKTAQVDLAQPVQYLIGVLLLVISAVAARRADGYEASLVIALGALLSVWRQPYDLLLVAGPLALLVVSPCARAGRAFRLRALVAFVPAALSWPFGHAGAEALGLDATGASRLSIVPGAAALGCWAVCVHMLWRRGNRLNLVSSTVGGEGSAHV